MANKLSDIQAQIAALQAEAAEMIAKEKADVVEEMKKDIATYSITAKELGFTSRSASGAGTTEKASTSAATVKKTDADFKYIKSEKEKWSGSNRGLKPAWVEAAKADGTLENYRNTKYTGTN
jgi:DNA-binding protein H-NS